MKIFKWNLEKLDSYNYVVFTKRYEDKRTGKKYPEDPAYFSRPNIIPALKHIRQEMIDEKFKERGIQKLDDFLIEIKSIDDEFLKYLKGIVKNIIV